MPLPESKSQLIEALRKSAQALDGEYENMPAKEARLPEIEGAVSAADLLAYQIGWGELLLSWEETESQGGTPEMPAKGYKWNELGKLAESFYKSRSRKSVKALRQEFHDVLEALEAWVEGLDDRELFEIGIRRWTGEKWPMVKWIQVNTIAPYKSARTKLRRWKKQRGGTA